MKEFGQFDMNSKTFMPFIVAYKNRAELSAADYDIFDSNYLDQYILNKYPENIRKGISFKPFRSTIHSPIQAIQASKWGTK